MPGLTRISRSTAFWLPHRLPSHREPPGLRADHRYGGRYVNTSGAGMRNRSVDVARRLTGKSVPDPSPKNAPEVDAYIAHAPVAVRKKLETLRSAIRSVVPDATELISYQMPGYSYPGYRFKGMFAWFGLQSGHIGLYLRPPTIQNHRRELVRYATTKSAVHLPFDQEIPTRLVQKLVRASLRVMTDEKR